MMQNKEEMKARLEAIENELWAIDMCDARNQWNANWQKKYALEAEKRAIIKALNEQ